MRQKQRHGEHRRDREVPLPHADILAGHLPYDRYNTRRGSTQKTQAISVIKTIVTVVWALLVYVILYYDELIGSPEEYFRKTWVGSCGFPISDDSSSNCVRGEKRKKKKGPRE